MFNRDNLTKILKTSIVDYTLPPPKAVLGTKLKTNEKIGLEIELEKVRLKKDVMKVPYWNTVNDGSLKIKGKEFTICIHSNKTKQAVKLLKDNLLTSDSSQRTSVHVHLNVHDITPEELMLLLLYYYVFETPLITYSGGRFNNFFCVPVAQWWRGNLEEIGMWKKYSSINILPIPHEQKHTRFSTVEFRSMRGNLNEDYIQNWVDILVHLKQYVVGKTLDDFAKFIYDANKTSSYYPLIKEIFKTKTDLLLYPNIEKHIETNISLLKFHLYNNGYLTKLYADKKEITQTTVLPHIVWQALQIPVKKEEPKTTKKAVIKQQPIMPDLTALTTLAQNNNNNNPQVTLTQQLINIQLQNNHTTTVTWDDLGDLPTLPVTNTHHDTFFTFDDPTS